ncbi:MAG: glycosyltransferase family 2 protein, partial [Patescibacteria group bacterium]
RQCLAAILSSTLKPKEIIVVDNNSSDFPDADIEKIKKISKSTRVDLRIIKSSTNLGFGKAVNLASKEARGNALVLINPDFLVDKTSLETISNFAKKRWSYLGAVGGRSRSYDGKSTEKTVANIPTKSTLLVEFTSLKKIFEAFGFSNPSHFWNTETICSPLKNKKVGAVSGCFMLIKKGTFRKIGGFDEKFFLYLEDLDLCKRLQSLGLNNFYVPSATGKHYGGGSSKKSPYKIDEKAWNNSKRYYCLKHHKTFGKMFIVLFFVDDLIVKIKKKLFL